jgi:RND family efflux transporter MFP subunit
MMLGSAARVVGAFVPHGAVVLLMAAIVGCGLFPEETDQELVELPEPPQLLMAATYPVEREDIAVEIRGSAVVDAVRRTEHYFTRGGRLHQILVEPNQEVDEGDLLASMPSLEVRYQLDMAEIDLQIAELSARRITGMGVAPIEGEIALLRIEKQRRAVRHLRDRLEETRVRALHDGVVTRVLVELSDMVREYEPVVEVADVGELELQMNVGRDRFDEFFVGQRVLFEYRADRWLDAEVVRLTHRSPRDDVSVSRDTYVVHLEPVDPQLELRMNARHSVRIVLEESSDTLTIPRSALREFNDRTYVRVLEGESRREADVRTGIENDTRVEILEGLEEGDLVIGR